MKCIVEGCDNESTAHGLCQMHYMRSRRNNGDTSDNKVGRKLGGKNKTYIVRTCTVEGCNGEVVAKGLCMKHYKQHRRSVLKGEQI